jgi:Na+/H+ antiporter NhaD/arsenite permease-like protein
MNGAAAVASSIVFAFTYLLLAWPRLRWLPIGRPAAALVGAVAMVLIGALSPTRAYEAIDGNTLVLLFALMAFSGHLERAGLFERLSDAALRSELSPGALLTLLVFGSGLLSALLLNDTVCVFLTPIVCNVCVRRGLPLGPYLMALATSSNIGSAATLIGNPQNILIGSLGPLDFRSYAAAVAPAALLGLAVNALLLRLWFRRALRDAVSGPTRVQRDPRSTTAPLEKLPLVVAVALVIAYASGLHLAFATLTALAFLLVAERRESRAPFGSVDWPLIVFFAALFVVVAGFASTGLPQAAWHFAAPHLELASARGVAWFTGYTLLGSNLFSNVPLVMLTGPLLAELGTPERGFALLGFVSTVAGNLTLLGSIANLIVAERARQHHELGFFEYLRFGVVSTLLVLAIGVPVVCLLT